MFCKELQEWVALGWVEEVLFENQTVAIWAPSSCFCFCFAELLQELLLLFLLLNCCWKQADLLLAVLLTRQVQFQILPALAICQKRKQLLLVNCCCCWLVVILEQLLLLIACCCWLDHAMQELCASGLACSCRLLLLVGSCMLAADAPALLVHAALALLPDYLMLIQHLLLLLHLLQHHIVDVCANIMLPSCQE